MSRYIVGATLRLKITYFDVNGVAADATSPTVTITNESNGAVAVNAASLSEFKDATGQYHYDFNPSTEGRYRVELRGSVGGMVVVESMMVRVHNVNEG